MGFPACPSAAPRPASCNAQTALFESYGVCEMSLVNANRSASACARRRPNAFAKTAGAINDRACTASPQSMEVSTLLNPPQSAREWWGRSTSSCSSQSQHSCANKNNGDKDSNPFADDGTNPSCTMQPWWSKLVHDENRPRSQGRNYQLSQRRHKVTSPPHLGMQKAQLVVEPWVGTGIVRYPDKVKEVLLEQRAAFSQPQASVSSPSPTRNLRSVRAIPGQADDTVLSSTQNACESVCRNDAEEDEIGAFEINHLRTRADKVAGQYCGQMQRLQDFQKKWFRKQVLRARRKEEEERQKRLREEEERAAKEAAEKEARDSFATRSKKRNSLHLIAMSPSASLVSDTGSNDEDEESEASLDSFGEDFEDEMHSHVARHDSLSKATQVFRDSEDRHSGTFPVPLDSEHDQEADPSSPQTKYLKAQQVRDCLGQRENAPRMYPSILKKSGTMRGSGGRCSALAHASWYRGSKRHVKIVTEGDAERYPHLFDKRQTLENNARMSTRGTNNGVRPPQPQPTASDAIKIARRYRLGLTDVREHLTEFKKLDTCEQGYLTREQFLVAVRTRLLLGEGEEIPEAVLEQVWRTTDSTGDGTIDFEEFIAWTQTIAFSDMMAGADPHKSRIRELSTQHGVSVPDIEYMWKEYQKWDGDNSGNISQREFQGLLRELLNSQNSHDISKERLNRFWADADHAKNGCIHFSEFLVWYMRYFVPLGSRASDGDADPASMVYRKLGTDRLQNYWMMPAQTVPTQKSEDPSVLAQVEKASSEKKPERRSFPVLSQVGNQVKAQTS